MTDGLFVLLVVRTALCIGSEKLEFAEKLRPKSRFFAGSAVSQ